MEKFERILVTKVLENWQKILSRQKKTVYSEKVMELFQLCEGGSDSYKGSRGP